MPPQYASEINSSYIKYFAFCLLCHISHINGVNYLKQSDVEVTTLTEKLQSSQHMSKISEVKIIWSHR